MPRKLSADSVRMAPAIPRVAATRIEAMAFGRMWMKMILKSLAPIALAAWTKSRSFRLMKSARTSRVMPIQPVMPMITMIFHIDGSRTAMTARMRKNVGKHSMMSTNRMITVSTIRP